MSPGWRSASSPSPGRQPDPAHTEGAGTAVTVPGKAEWWEWRQAEWEWRKAAALLDNPDVVELILVFHGLREGRRHCVQCGPRVFWPCEPWLVATLARMRRAGAPPRRKKRISWPRRTKADLVVRTTPPEGQDLPPLGRRAVAVMDSEVATLLAFAPARARGPALG